MDHRDTLSGVRSIDLRAGADQSGPMSLANRMTRLPRAYDPDLGAEARAAAPGLTGQMADLIEGAGGSSPFLKELIEREAEWITHAAHDPEVALQGVFDDVARLAPDQLKPGLRRGKRRVALITALADLSGAWTLEQVTGALSDFADLACEHAIRAEIGALVRRGKLSGQTEDDVATAGGMFVLAMGKMGAGELNYSSDIDLICLFDETRFDPGDFMDARQGFVRATRAMCATLSERTADGYVFRTDLRLRPDPAVTPVCISMDAAERYYESLGRTWERAAFVKARPAAGDIEAGKRFLSELNPFIWRRHLDFAAIEDAHNIRLRIRESKGFRGPLTIPGHDLKLGRGGIREIEFFTQTRQLISGGRDPDLRQRGTVAGLSALAKKGWVGQDVCDQLSAHYRALRDVEHRIQMVHDAQTHKVPKSSEGIDRIACLMGLDADQLVADLTQRLTQVHGLTESFFAPGGGSVDGDVSARASVSAGEGATASDVVEADVRDVTMDPEILARWANYPALRSERAAHIFARLRPELLTRLARVSRPDEALAALDGFLAGLPAGVQLFSLFDANPQLIDLLVDIVGTSPALANHLARNSAVFDAVIGGDFFSDWPTQSALQGELSKVLQAEGDYEARLDTARRWTKEWHFRIGVHLLRGLASPEDAGRQYADLAHAVVAQLFPVVVDQFSLRHGPPPGRGAAVLGMGSLGAGRLNAGSDLDMIVIYDPADVEMSDGPRPLASRTYYARLTQALITAMTAPMSQGRLYEVDMRLRPSGNQGPVATSWKSFQDYQRNDAWVWEHLALTRASVVAGSPQLGADIEAFRRDLLQQTRPKSEIMEQLSEMRARIAAAKTSDGVWDAKTGAGRLQDIELIAQAGALLSGRPERDVQAGLQGGVATGWLQKNVAATLGAFYDLFWSVNVATRLVSDGALDTEGLGQGGAAFLCRCTGYENLAALGDALEDGYARSAVLIEAALDNGECDEG